MWLLQKFERALYYFEACVTIPTMAVSHIMLEAYKKYLLVSLIVHGDKPRDTTALPKYTSPVINKYLKPLCASYQELVGAYYSNQTTELEVRLSGRCSLWWTRCSPCTNGLTRVTRKQGDKKF